MNGESGTPYSGPGDGFGPIAPELLAQMSGRQVLQAMIDRRLPGPTMARTMNFRLHSVGDGECVFIGEPTDGLLNPLGTVHGGWVLTLIDSACGCSAHSTLPAGVGYSSLETKANMVRPILPSTGSVTVSGKVISRGRQIITAEASVHDSRKRLLAHGTSTLIVLRPGG